MSTDNNFYILSKLKLINLVDFSTPHDVLIDVAYSHNILYDEENLNNPYYMRDLITRINTTKITKVKYPYDNDNMFNLHDIPKISRYVNGENLTIENLSIAFNYLANIIPTQNFILSLTPNFEFGKPTNSQPLKLNASVLYYLCQRFRINTNYDTSSAHMAYLIKVRISQSTPTLQTSVYQIINQLTHEDLVNVIGLYTSYHFNPNHDNHANHLQLHSFGFFEELNNNSDLKKNS
jgi:hypothetical protein